MSRALKVQLTTCQKMFLRQSLPIMVKSLGAPAGACQSSPAWPQREALEHQASCHMLSRCVCVCLSTLHRSSTRLPPDPMRAVKKRATDLRHSGVASPTLASARTQRWQTSSSEAEPMLNPNPDSSLSCALQYTWWSAGVLSLIFIIIWPVLVIPAGVFNLGYFGL